MGWAAGRAGCSRLTEGGWGKRFGRADPGAAVLAVQERCWCCWCCCGVKEALCGRADGTAGRRASAHSEASVTEGVDSKLCGVRKCVTVESIQLLPRQSCIGSDCCVLQVQTSVRQGAHRSAVSPGVVQTPVFVACLQELAQPARVHLMLPNAAHL